MLDIAGKFCTAHVYADSVDDATFKQVLNLMNQPFAAGSDCAIMPDCHAGTGCVIGLTMKITDKVVPNLVGVDIGCGMLVMKVSKEFPLDLKTVDKIWHNDIPSGMNHRRIAHKYARKVPFSRLATPVNADKAALSIGTLGSGNHFFEIDEDSEGHHYFVIHSGSRHLGIDVCKFHQQKAVVYHFGDAKRRADVIARCKAEGRVQDIERELNSIALSSTPVPNELAYLEGVDMTSYLNDMAVAQEFARLNREAMMDTLVTKLGIKRRHILDTFCTMHNYVDLEHMIVRKGAISLRAGELAIIPMNMRDGSLIVRGKGASEWNMSGPHGAGRLMSRSLAKEQLSMEEFKQSMQGIYTTCVSTSTIDESPMAYKPYETIMDAITPTAEIIERIKPIYNFKAGE